MKYTRPGGDSLSKLVNGYNAVLISADVTVGQNIDGCKNDIGKNGQLTIWESENLHPGRKYIRFQTADHSVEIQTACGDISISNDIFEISTQSGANTYRFKLLEHIQTIDFRMKLPERYWHICNGCGKRELLSSKEAFEQGWDYPGPDGIYKTMPNYGFGTIAPRTCGDCCIAMDKLYLALATKSESVEEVMREEKETLARIQNEPWSLMESEEDLGDEHG